MAWTWPCLPSPPHACSDPLVWSSASVSSPLGSSHAWLRPIHAARGNQRHARILRATAGSAERSAAHLAGPAAAGGDPPFDRRSAHVRSRSNPWRHLAFAAGVAAAGASGRRRRSSKTGGWHGGTPTRGVATRELKIGPGCRKPARSAAPAAVTFFICRACVPDGLVVPGAGEIGSYQRPSLICLATAGSVGILLVAGAAAARPAACHTAAGLRMMSWSGEVLAAYEPWNELRARAVIAELAGLDGAALPILHRLQAIFGCIHSRRSR